MFSPRHQTALTIVAGLFLALVGYRVLVRPVVVPGPGGEPATAPTSGLKFDPNTASVEDLSLVPGLGPAKARALVAHREAHPDTPFESLEDLRRITGFGPGTLDRIGPYLSFSPPQTRPASP